MVWLFLRDLRATLIPMVSVPVSVIGTFGVMYLLGFSLDNLSLMALTISTGFVVDDAIVVLENISRHVEDGMPAREAALRGSAEVGFTVVSITLSLIAVFLPILLDGRHRRAAVPRVRGDAVDGDRGVAGDLADHHADAVRADPAPEAGADGRCSWAAAAAERSGSACSIGYGRTLAWTLEHNALVLLVLAATIAVNVWLLVVIPKGFFPTQDNGRLIGAVQADQRHLVPGDEQEARADDGDRAARSGGAERGRLHRRRRRRRHRADQHRQRLRGAEAEAGASTA